EQPSPEPVRRTAPPVTMIPICATRLATASPQVRRSTRPSRDEARPGEAAAGGVADAGRGLVEVTSLGYVPHRRRQVSLRAGLRAVGERSCSRRKVMVGSAGGILLSAQVGVWGSGGILLSAQVGEREAGCGGGMLLSAGGARGETCLPGVGGPAYPGGYDGHACARARPPRRRPRRQPRRARRGRGDG